MTEHEEALARFQFADDATSSQRQREKEDLAFQVPEKQWPDDIRAARGPQIVAGVTIPGRPMLSVASIDEPVQLILNLERAAHLGVHIHAETDEADADTAQMLEGLYRGIESDSHAMNVRSWAYDRSTKCGLGAYRINKVHDPHGGHPFDQKLKLQRLLDQSNAFFDPFAIEPDWSDGEFAFVTDDMRWSTYKRRYPKSTMALNYSDGDLVGVQTEQPKWIGGQTEEQRTVRVAEYWRVVITERTYVLLDDGTVTFEDEIPDGRKAMEGDGARSLKIEERKVLWSVMNAIEFCEPAQEWDGQFIPLIPTIGRELQPFDRERRWVGMIGPAKDGARLTNYAASGAVELASLEPKVPWQGVEGVFEGHEKEYAESAVRSIPFLQHKPTDLDGKPAPAPIRVQVDTSRMGPSMELLRMGRDFVQTATSTFDPALGKQPTAHRSGRAIVALQDQTVEGTSHYLANLANISMTHEARVMLDLIPRIYDRPGRLARITDADDSKKQSTVILNHPFVIDPRTKRPQPVDAGANPSAVAADQTNPVKHYNLGVGRYGVSVTIGKTSTSRMQAGANEMGELLAADPSLMPIIGPEYFNYRDFPGARGIAKLLKKMRDHQMPWLSDEGPDPAAELSAAKSQIEKMTQQLHQASDMLKTDFAKTHATVDIKKFEIASKERLAITLQAMKDATMVEVARITAAKEAANAALEAHEEAIALGSTQAFDERQADILRRHEAALVEQEHRNTMEQADQATILSMGQAEQTNAHALEQTAAAAPPAGAGA